LRLILPLKVNLTAFWRRIRMVLYSLFLSTDTNSGTR
jgi:hypothetical protein